jgi:hypothetical protein
MKLLLENWRKYLNETDTDAGEMQRKAEGDGFKDFKDDGDRGDHWETLEGGKYLQYWQLGYDNAAEDWEMDRYHDGIDEGEQNISYSGVVLDEPSKQKLLTLDIPEGWEPVAHHMTITMGPLTHPKGKHDFSTTYPVGTEIVLPVIAVGKDERAMAVKVGAPSPIKTKSWPHITVAVNRDGGGKPFHSNKIPEENFQPLSGIVLKGKVQEVPQ